MNSPLSPQIADRRGSFSSRPLRSTLAALGVLLLSAATSPGLIISDDVDFSVVYNATALPNDSNPAWQLLTGGAASGSAVIADGALVFDTPTVGARYYRINNASLWNGGTSTGSTIEFSMKVGSLSEDAANTTLIYFSTGNRGYGFFFRPGEITYQAGANAPVHGYDTTTDFNRYRITLSGAGEASLYVNDAATPLISGYTGTALGTASNFIYFGDASNVAGGISYWEYVAFTNAASVAPIPEGGAAMLTLLGGGLLVGGIRLANRRKAGSLS